MQRLLRACTFTFALVTALFSSAALAQYQKAPQPIHDLLSAPPTPLVLVSPKSDQLLVAERLQYPPISDLAQPMLRLAGLRINPATNGRHHPPRFVGLSLVDVATGKSHKVIDLPEKPYLGVPEWSPTSEFFAFTSTTADGIELWVGLSGYGEAHKIPGVRVSAILGDAFQWMPDGHTLLVQTVPAHRGKTPAEPKSPEGPIIQESDGKKAPVRTYEDLLANTHDEDLFDYYATTQLVSVPAGGGSASTVVRAILKKVAPSRYPNPPVFRSLYPRPSPTPWLLPDQAARVSRPASPLPLSTSI